MNTFKKIILFLFGVALIIFGNKSAIDAISGAEKENDKKSKEEPKKTSSGFEIMKAGDTSVQSESNTVIESDSAETASPSE